MDRGGTIRYLLWDGLNCLEERNADGSLHARYTYGYSPIYGIGSCVEIYKPGSPDKWHTLIMDHRGTAYAILDENGAEIGRRHYDAFGVILSQTGTWPTDLAYQTNWQTIQIGNKWWGLSLARLYDFVAGRFTQRDFAHANINLYTYSTNNTDPLGLMDFEEGTEDPPVPSDEGSGEHNSKKDAAGKLAAKMTRNFISTKLPFSPYPDAAAHLLHYFGNSGATYTIRFAKLIQDSSAAKEAYEKELDAMKAYAETLPEGEHKVTSKTATGVSVTKGDSANWFYAVGSYSAWGKGKIKVKCITPTEKEYTLEFEYKFKDRYNWDTGKGVQIGPFGVTDEMMQKFHQYGEGKEFDMVGSVTSTTTWRKTNSSSGTGGATGGGATGGGASSGAGRTDSREKRERARFGL